MHSRLSNPVSTSHPKARTRADYSYFLSYRTRWSDNDQYSHINNAVYYHFIDSVINAYLIAHCDLSPQTSDTVGVVVSSHCQFFSPLSYPDVLDLGLRVNHIGQSSVTYEVGVFREGSTEPAAVGGYTHVFVDAVSRKSSRIRERVREGLQGLSVGPSNSKPESKL
ncbi:thioesterase thiol ester dehydrase-isomerase [Russula compacta]|nr:thioesterase thiol ester dehydrase-isomerase [Russula compacta]